VLGWCVEGASIIELCEKGDKLIEEEVAKVYKGKKIPKGQSHPTTISPSSYVTPYTPLKSDADEAEATLKKGEIVKIQLGAQIDGLGTIVCNNFVVPGKGEKEGEITDRDADLLLATYYANELLMRLILPPGTLAATEEEKTAAAGKKQYTQSQMNAMLDKVAKSYKVNIVENTTSWLFERNEIEGAKKIILSAGDGVKGEGLPAVGEVWGIEIGLSLSAGKVKTLPQRTTLHRRTGLRSDLKRPSSRATFSEIKTKFGQFPFSLRQLEDERAGKVGVVEAVRANLLRAYEVAADKEGTAVSRLLTTVGKSFGYAMNFDHGYYQWSCRPSELRASAHVGLNGLINEFTQNTCIMSKWMLTVF
jgi:methionine aminopeptidase